MEKTITAKFNRGLIEPLEALELEEGKKFIITLKEIPSEDRFKKAAGGWKDLVDCKKLLKDIYESRKIRRPEVNL